MSPNVHINLFIRSPYLLIVRFTEPVLKHGRTLRSAPGPIRILAAPRGLEVRRAARERYSSKDAPASWR